MPIYNLKQFISHGMITTKSEMDKRPCGCCTGNQIFSMGVCQCFPIWAQLPI